MPLVHPHRSHLSSAARLAAAALALAALVPAMSPAETAAAGKNHSACPNDDSGLILPAGFCAGVFADEIGHSRHLVVAPNGVVYVNTWSGVYYGNDTPHAGGFLVALKDSTGSGKADVNQRFGETVQTGGAGGTGIGFYNGSLYAEINDKIVRYALPAAAMVPSGSAQTVVAGLPLGGDHPMHPFAIDASGVMYIDVGTATNSCQPQNRTLESPGAKPCTELETRGGIWRYDANKTDQRFSPAERYATGIRNGEGFAVDTAGRRVFVTQHGRDQLRSNWPAFYELSQEATLPAEELLRLEKGGDYGWPECYFDSGQHKLMLAPEYGGDGHRVGVCAAKIAPVADFPAHWAPDGAVFYDKEQFPSHYRNGIFIAFHGSWNRAPYPQKGYNVVFQPMAGDQASGKCEIFADGFAGKEKSPDKAAHRPTGLAVGPDGSLYVSDDVRGRIYRIVYRGGPAAAGDAGRTVPCPSASAPPGAITVAEAKPPEGTHAGASDAATLPVPEGATAEMVVLGERIYHGQVGGATCTGCHGSDATGSPLGPNLTTNRWFWSDGTNAGIAATIRVGVMHPKNYRAPMPPMGGAQLTAEQVSAVADYVWALSQPAAAATGARVPAELAIPGEKVFPESITSAADGRMFIGSIVKREIFAVKPGEAAARPWIDADGNTALGVYGVFPIGADGKSGAISAVTLNRPIQAPDGMRSFGKEGMLLVESGGKGRLSLLEVQGSTGQVTTLKEGFPEGPVSVAVVGTSAYVLEGQLDALFGPAQPNRALKPFHATA